MENADKMNVKDMGSVAEVAEDFDDDQDAGTPNETPVSTARAGSSGTPLAAANAIDESSEKKPKRRSNLKLSLMYKTKAPIDEPVDAEAGALSPHNPEGEKEGEKKSNKKDKKKDQKKKGGWGKLLVRAAGAISSFGVKFKILISLYQVLTGLGIGAST